MLVLAAVLAFVGTRSDGLPFDPDSTEPIPHRQLHGSVMVACGDIGSPFDYGRTGVTLNPEPVTPRQALAQTLRNPYWRKNYAHSWRPTGDLYRTVYGNGYALLLMSGDRLNGWFAVTESYFGSGEWRVTEFRLC